MNYPLRATSGTDGQFRFTFIRSELDAKSLDEARPAVVAVAVGHGPAWAEIGDGVRGTQHSLRLIEDLPLNGRILDQSNKPVAGANLAIRDIASASDDSVARILQGDADSWPLRSWRGAFPGQPPRVTTDSDGRFRLSGLGRDRVVRLTLEGPAIQHGFVAAVTRLTTALPSSGGLHGAMFEHVSLPSRTIRGVVRDQTTGQPVAGVRMGGPNSAYTTLTDERGRYELTGCPTSQGFVVLAQPEQGRPYFTASASVPSAPGVDANTVNFDLISGIPLQGHVTDQATRKPPKTAVIEYYPLFPNAQGSRLTNVLYQAASSAPVQPDGTYRLVVLPGPGVVCVAASPRNSHAAAALDDQELADLFHDGSNHGGGKNLITAGSFGARGSLCVSKYHALALINPNEKVESLTLNLTLQSASALQGSMIGPGGEPLTGVHVTGLTALPEEELLDEASFTVMGLNPRCTRELFFQHREKGLGKVLTVHGDELEPIMVQLEPWCWIMGRLVNTNGKPVPGTMISFVGGPVGIDTRTKTDRDGCFRISLPPGKKYFLRVSGSRRLLRNVAAVELASGQSKDLGDLSLGD
jgi:hypothetical protein